MFIMTKMQHCGGIMWVKRKQPEPTGSGMLLDSDISSVVFGLQTMEISIQIFKV